MKVLFVESRKKDGKSDIKDTDVLPKKLHLLYTIQYKKLAEDVKRNLGRSHQILGFEQVLGCSEIKPKADILLIGSGRFHALSIAASTLKPIFVYEDGKITRIEEKELLVIQNKRKAKLSKFLSSENVGLIVSSKPGQNKLEEALNFKNKHKEKNFYIFLADTISPSELENFPLDIFVNFACPGLEMDSAKILNHNNT